MDQPTFETERLIVRPRRLADTPACLAMDGDPEVVRFIPGPWLEPIAHRAFVEARTRGPYPAGMGYWAVVPKEAPNEFLGWASLIPWETKGPWVEIGWRLRRAVWRRGYASEAAAPLIPHGFEALGLDEIIADIHPDNAASIGVATKLGFRLRQARLKPDYTIGYYGLTRAERRQSGARVRI